MANVIWPEIGHAIMDELGLVIFAVGKPDEFLKVAYYFTDPASLILVALASRGGTGIYSCA